MSTEPISGQGENLNTEPNGHIDPQDPNVGHVDPNANPNPSPSDDDDLPHGVKKRIGKLTARLHGQESYVKSLEKRLAELAEKTATSTQANWDDLPVEEQIKQLAREEAQQIIRNQQSQATAMQQQEVVISNFQTQLGELEKNVPQAREIIADAEPYFAQIGAKAQMQILGSNHAAEIALELAKNPNLALQLAGMDAESKSRFIDRIELKIELRKEMAPAQQPQASQQSQQRAPAPPMPQSSRGGSAAPPVNPDDMSFEQYRQWRNQSRKKA
jgi:hypothetical protein